MDSCVSRSTTSLAAWDNPDETASHSTALPALACSQDSGCTTVIICTHRVLTFINLRVCSLLGNIDWRCTLGLSAADQGIIERPFLSFAVSPRTYWLECQNLATSVQASITEKFIDIEVASEPFEQLADDELQSAQCRNSKPDFQPEFPNRLSGLSNSWT